ncbi:MAG: hypothetical protein O2854_08820 [Chloroflexi bacterium]|nr:hypothetical protein [Chloroflexota bacterium]
MKEAPFTCSGKAKRFISRLLTCGPNLDPAIVVAMGMEARDAKGQPSARVNGMHFTIGYYPKGERDPESFFSFHGKPVSIMPTTLDHLANRHLVLTKPDWTKRRFFVKMTILRAEHPPA